MNRKNKIVYKINDSYFINNKLLSNKNLTTFEKFLLTVIISNQKINGVCTFSSKELALILGSNISSIKRCISNLNNYDWFNSEERISINQYSNPINYRETSVDEEVLNIWLNNNNK